MEKVYKIRAGFHYPSEDAPVIGRELERIESIGELSSVGVLRAAKPAGSCLHKYFTWDDDVAIEGYRLGEARHLINAIEVEFIQDEVEVSVPLVRHVTILRDEGVESRDVLVPGIEAGSPEAEEIIEDAKRRFIGWKNQYMKYLLLWPTDFRDAGLAGLFEHELD